MRQMMLAASCAALMAGTAAAQDTMDFDLSGFDEIDAGGGFRLEVTVGEDYSVRMEGDGDDFDRLELEVRGDELHIEQRARLFGRNPGLDVTIYVSVPAVDALDFHRGISADVDGIDAGRLQVDVNTGASVDLSGTCTQLDIDVSTGSDTDAGNLVCEDVSASASTGAGAHVHATESITARASMGAGVRVSGSPRVRELRSTMGGDIYMDRNG